MADGERYPVIMSAEKAVPGGVATLDESGILLAAQRPNAGQIYMPDGISPVSEALSNKVEAAPPEWYNLPLATSITGDAKYCKDQFGLVSIVLNIKNNTGVDNQQIATLPIGFRPTTVQYRILYDGWHGKLSHVDLYPDGRVIGVAYDQSIFTSAQTEMQFFARD